MSKLTNDEIKALAKAVNLEIYEADLTQVRYSLNAMLDAIDRVDVPDLENQEPIPIIPPQEDING